MNDWIPLYIAAIISFGGSIASYFLARREREAKTTNTATESYSRLVSSLESRIAMLEDEVKELRAENKILRQMWKDGSK